MLSRLSASSTLDIVPILGANVIKREKKKKGSATKTRSKGLVTMRRKSYILVLIARMERKVKI